VSFVQRPARWTSYRVSYTLSKAMNNVGEFFFSSPIDPTDLSKDWGRSDDDQRHRFVFNGTVNSSMEPASTFWGHLSHGFLFSTMVQAYSKLPYNITSGVTTIQGTNGRPIVDGEVIPRNAGIGSDFFSLGVRLMRTFRLGGNLRLEGAVEAFNLTNRTNVVTRNTNFGAGEYPTNPAPTYGQITGVGDPRTYQFRCGYGSERRRRQHGWPNCSRTRAALNADLTGRQSLR
jgi:hypothetical protein